MWDGRSTMGLHWWKFVWVFCFGALHTSSRGSRHRVMNQTHEVYVVTFQRWNARKRQQGFNFTRIVNQHMAWAHEVCHGTREQTGNWMRNTMRDSEWVSALSVSKSPGSNVDRSGRTKCLAMKTDASERQPRGQDGSTSREQKNNRTDTHNVRAGEGNGALILLFPL